MSFPLSSLRALFAASLLSLGLGACAGGPDSRFYEATDEGALRLRDGSLLVATEHVITPTADTVVQRELRAQDGRLQVLTRTADERERSYPLEEKAWIELWRSLLERGLLRSDFGLEVQPRDPGLGASYHLVTARLAERESRFSSQYYQNLLGVLSTGDVQDRLELVNTIVRAVQVAQEKVDEGPSADG